jgi:tRNA/tmRNA/rRNA uracil-C5-methylase (TrmA/RlmC/RlmD family)
MHRARSHEIVHVADCPIADEGVIATVLQDVRPDEEFRAAIGSDGFVAVERQGDSAHVRETVTTPQGAHTWSVPVGAFWQVHRGLPRYLGDTVMGVAGPVIGESWWDLYAGVGLLTAFLADAGASRVDSVESDPRACTAARRTFHNRSNVVLHHAEVGTWLAEQPQPPHGMVLDPPRSGCGPAVTKQLVALGVPRIIYVACDPAGLARDVRILRSGGYEVQRVLPIDAFPMTHHVETVALLVQRDRLS